MIVEANEAFASVSGFERHEMIGQPHNIVRHPDMPGEALPCLTSARAEEWPSWRAIVKNRRKDGGFYWVVASLAGP